MVTRFRIGVNTAKEILANPPPQFRHVNLIFTPFAVTVGRQDYPAPMWTDFAGIFLFRWYRAVLNLSGDKSRAARLPFWYRYEMWLRRTKGQWWRLSLVQRERKEQTALHEALVIPEVVEAALLTAIQNLLAGARSAGVWGEDCIALDALLKGRESYLEDMEAGRIPTPSFLSGRIPAQPPSSKPMPGISFGSAFSPTLDPRASAPKQEIPPAIRRRMVTPPVLCPRCNAVLPHWGEKVTEQTCPLCKYVIRLA